MKNKLPSTSTPNAKTQSTLEEDPIHAGSLRYALISVVGEHTTQGFERSKDAPVAAQCALKIRGAFATKEDAQKHAERLVKLDPLFDLYLVDMYKWLAVPPDPVALAEHCDEVYGDSFLNDLVNKHKEEQLKSREFLEQRRLDNVSMSIQKNAGPNEGEGSRQ